MDNIVIIGGGIAGTAAAEELRKRLPTVNITIITEEVHPCYSRVLLPHYVKDKVVREKVFLRSSAWYFEQKIELMAGVRVLEIDLENKFVRTSEDRELPFDKLLITTGGEIGLLNDDLRGVSYLHSIDDADTLKALIGQLRTRPSSEQAAGIYGGGFIACEYANIFKHFEVPFSLIMRGPGFWSKILSPESQQILQRQAESQGVKIFTNEPMPTLLGEDELIGVRLASGTELKLGLLGVGIGMQTDERMLADARIPVASGVLVNEYLETEIKDVYAAGDVAEFTDVIVNRRVKYGNWMNAQMQGRVVGASMAGERTAFKLASSYATNLLGLHIVFLGDTSREHADDIRIGQVSDTTSEEIFLRDGKLVGAVLIGNLSRRAALTKNLGHSL